METSICHCRRPHTLGTQLGLKGTGRCNLPMILLGKVPLVLEKGQGQAQEQELAQGLALGLDCYRLRKAVKLKSVVCSSNHNQCCHHRRLGLDCHWAAKGKTNQKSSHNLLKNN